MTSTILVIFFPVFAPLSEPPPQSTPGHGKERAARIMVARPRMDTACEILHDIELAFEARVGAGEG